MTADGTPAAARFEMDQLAAAVVRTIREPLLVLDDTLAVLSANPAFYDTFEVLPEATLGRPLPALGDNEWSNSELRSQLEAVQEGGPPIIDFQVEHEFEHIGERIILISARRIEREGEDLILLALQDETESVQARREQEELLEALERSNRDLERFAYIASHDLQEPLRMIASYTELLARRYQGELDERADKYIGYAVDGARRMQAMIGGLLEYSRAGRLEDEFEQVDLGDVLAEVRRDLSVALEETGAELETEALPVVRGDATRLAQVFRNLISNALKFQDGARPKIRVTAERIPEGLWRIGVHDNGIGIDPEYYDKVFVIFRRLNPREAFSGAGLGLALCRKVVEHHGGRMEVESEPGVGSSFFVILPVPEDG